MSITYLEAWAPAAKKVISVLPASIPHRKGGTQGFSKIKNILHLPLKHKQYIAILVHKELNMKTTSMPFAFYCQDLLNLITTKLILHAVHIAPHGMLFWKTFWHAAGDLRIEG